CTEPPASVRLQDFSELNVSLGRKLIAERRLPTSVSFHQADAFDAEMLAGLEPARTWPSSPGFTNCFPTTP
ncbi:class I SAM-dependent methyltransferase family protein, partial [Mesorhizobium sp.]|uniref:class I SAM-dependent methyltransferase family protein n=1 Tax=Mesorhizobium sp. TaxID=1871066 RepID=UPI00345DD1FE